MKTRFNGAMLVYLIQNNMFLQINTQTIFDPKMFHYMGLSTKRDDINTIGKFGSGLKYAISWLMRNDLLFSVSMNGNPIKMSYTQDIVIDHKDNSEINVRVLSVNDVPTSITSLMGPDWEPWQVLREMLCNAYDADPKFTWDLCRHPNYEDTGTSMVIQLNPELSGILADYSRYFRFSEATDKPLIVPSKIQPLRIYFQGVLIYENDTINVPFYFLTHEADINEMRKWKEDWRAKESFWTALLASDNYDVDLIKSVFYNSDLVSLMHSSSLIDVAIPLPHIVDALKDWEYKTEYDNLADYFAGNVDAIQLDTVSINAHKILESRKLGKHISRRKYNENGYSEIAHSPILDKKLFEDLAWWAMHDIKMEYDFQFVDFQNDNVMASALVKEKKVLLSPKIFDENMFSVKERLSIYFEEHVHISTGFKDETRELQDYLFKTIVSLYDQRNN